jgi:hypothetical protein
MGALVGGAFSLAGTTLSTTATREGQEADRRDQLHQEQRKLRADAYNAFSEAAETYRESAAPSQDCRKLKKDEVAAVPKCQSATEPARWLALQKALTAVYLYGSEEAVKISEELVSLVRTVRQLRELYECELIACTTALTGRPGEGPSARLLHSQYLSQLEQYLKTDPGLRAKFTSQMCRELSLIPRQSC